MDGLIEAAVGYNALEKYAAASPNNFWQCHQVQTQNSGAVGGIAYTTTVPAQQSVSYLASAVG